MKFFIVGLLAISSLTACISYDNRNKLPILGPRDTETRINNGVTVVDTIYHSIPNFSFTNQNGEMVDNNTVEGKIYLVDFFFTSCPTICPIMTANLLKISKKFENQTNFSILSHSIDTRHDSVPVLKKYAEKIGAKTPLWHFLTGSKEDIYEIASAYLVSAEEDSGAPGGYIHSGAFILIDAKGRIRGYYDGTLERDVDYVVRDINTLLNEN